jgi:cation diffusion facilitator CzcD-associated flavoprotein CzcO
MRGKRVAVVGIGNTGCELACEIGAAGAEAVFLCARSGAWMIPKRIDGRAAAAAVPMMNPHDPIPGVLSALPRAAREWLFSRIAARKFRAMFGARNARFTELGLPPPPANPQDKRATICDPLLDSLESGAVLARPGIERFEGKEIVFSRRHARARRRRALRDGYQLRYPYLPTTSSTRATTISCSSSARSTRAGTTCSSWVCRARPARSGRSPRCRRSSPPRCSPGAMRCRARR